MAQIDHVVVLMLENRSFDSMLGRLDMAGLDGLDGSESNDWNGSPVTVWTNSGTGPDVMTIPKPGPHESFADMTAQIFGADEPSGATANMSGFVANYMRDPEDRVAKTVMHGFTPDQVPVITTLARAFGVSDRWHASAPNQTWPNRFFAHTGTGGGYVNNKPSRRLFQMKTIFNRLTQKQRSWRIYYHDLPHACLLPKIWSEAADHVYRFKSHFLDDAQSGRLPNYSFIEPRYFPWPLTGPPNDQHPSHDVGFGERLISRCYQALRSGPGWDRTLFIITYDEHGGMYDHVPPPAAVPPDDFAPNGFTFDRYGVRVPTVLVSPWIPAGSIVRPLPGSQYPFDHTSILSTLRTLFALGNPLTRRDAVAPDLRHALSLDAPTNDGPSHIPLPTVTARLRDLGGADPETETEPPNSMQRALAEAADWLPAGSASSADHAKMLARAAPPPSPPPATVAEARERARAGMRRFLGGPAADGPDI